MVYVATVSTRRYFGWTGCFECINTVLYGTVQYHKTV